jgi:hypothetical protein
VKIRVIRVLITTSLISNMDCSENKQLTYIKWITIFFLIIGFALSPKLWVGERLFPHIPVFDSLEKIPIFVSTGLFYTLILSFVIHCFTNNKWLLRGGFLLLFFVILQDQNRLQPWVFIYMLFLLPFCLTSFLNLSKPMLLNIFQIILICIYFWSGVHKINDNFIDIVYYDILTQFFGIQDEALIQQLLPLGYIIPATEIGIAIGFLIPKGRKIALILSILTHIFIILYLSPVGTGRNYIVLPWNLAMILLNVVVFYGNRERWEINFPTTKWLFYGNRERWEINFPTTKWLFYGNRERWEINFPTTKWVFYGYAFFLGVMPIFNFWGYWDDYLSFSLYSQKNKIFYIAISDESLSELSHQFDDYLVDFEPDVTGGEFIDVTRWAFQELKVPVYPEYRVFRKIMKHFCRYEIPEDDLIFLVYKQPVLEKNLIKSTCSNILF